VKPHRQSAAEALAGLASAAGGLSTAEATARLALHGPNVVDEGHRPSTLRLLGAQFADRMVLVLVGAAVVSAAVGEPADTAVILAIVLLNAVIGFVQEYRAAQAMEALRAMAAPLAVVLRDGVAQRVATASLVPGDIVILEAGAVVPADLRLLEAVALRLDESALTGESAPIDKSTDALDQDDLTVGERGNVAHKGTLVVHGRGVGVAFATGSRTEFGRIATMLAQAEPVDTPLQRRLHAFGRRLAVVVLGICAIVFVTGLLRGEATLPMLLTALSLAVAAIPEALPAVVSVALALGARRLMRHHALIRRLLAVEALGSVTVICSDKTGTLTANRMRVERHWSPGEPGLLLVAAAISHDATQDAGGQAVGDPTEVALLEFAVAQGIDPGTERGRRPRIGELPFDAGRRCMTTVHADAGGSALSFTKGAAETVIALCGSERRGSLRVPVDREALLREAEAMAGAGLRVLAIAVRNWTVPPTEVRPDVVERELEFIGLVGMIDPPRQGVAEAVQSCREAGLRPVMITGDHPMTARAVALRLGMEVPDAGVLTGAALASMPEAEFTRRVADVAVYARVAPEQKLRIVAALQARGEVVAMTGDGVNDAPALRRADVGVAMGRSGTDVAREAAGVVLLDDEFPTIVRAIREGRRIYDNLRRFVRYVLTTNSGEIWTIFLAPFLGMPVPLLAIQILWINLVTDGLPGLALAAEPAERNVMRRPPRPPAQNLFADGLGAHALLVGLTMAAIALGLQAWYLDRGTGHWQTIVFTALCFMQLGHVLAVRSERSSLFTLGLGTNRPLLAAVLATVAMQLAVVYLPAGNAWFRTQPLTGGELASCVLAALAILAVVEAEKAVRRRLDEPAGPAQGAGLRSRM
jgi:Ca2+-transporting ATPase